MILDILYNFIFLQTDSQDTIENIISDFENLLNFEDVLADLSSIIEDLMNESSDLINLYNGV